MPVAPRLLSRARPTSTAVGIALLLLVFLAACGTTAETGGTAPIKTDTSATSDAGVDVAQDASSGTGGDASGSDTVADSQGADGGDAAGDQGGKPDSAGSDSGAGDSGDGGGKTDAGDSQGGKDASDATGGPGSCVGKCGDYDSSSTCNCDAYCMEAGDCCDDFELVCSCATDSDCQAGVGNCGSASCQDGLCESTTKKCNDSNDCTADSCDPATGNCVSTPMANGTSCDNVGCKEGTCTAGSCKAGGNAPDGDYCDDGDPCSDDDECTGGTCKGLTPTDCDDYDECTADSCAAGAGCVNKPVSNGAACDDGDACTSGDSCQLGNCDGKAMAEGSPCDDGDACTLNDACTGGTCDGLQAKPGTPCDDEDPCTVQDVCTSAYCSGDYNDCEDGNPCSDDQCDSATGQCLNEPLKEGAKCDDDNDCTSATVCTGGSCLGTADPDGSACNDGNDCTDQEKCAQGQCLGQADPTAEGYSCDDGNGCTGNEVCATGVCIGVADVSVCDDDDPCTLDSCTNVFGNSLCSHTAAAKGASCDDGDPCTLGESCQAGKCLGGAGNCSAVWTDAVDCGSEAKWTLSPASAGQVGWAIDGTPNPPAPHSGACSLNFNNGKDFSDGKQVKGEATLKAQALAAGGDYVLSVWSWHDGESSKSYDKRRIQVSVNGLVFTPVVDQLLDNSAPAKTWTEIKLSLPGVAGKSVQVRFAFDSVDGTSNSGAGWFVDDLAILKVSK